MNLPISAPVMVNPPNQFPESGYVEMEPAITLPFVKFRGKIMSRAQWLLARKLVEDLTAQRDELLAALEFIVDREGLMFAECTTAEEILTRARAAIARAKEQL